MALLFTRGAFRQLKTFNLEEKEKPALVSTDPDSYVDLDASVSASLLVGYAGSEETGAIGSEETRYVSSADAGSDWERETAAL